MNLYEKYRPSSWPEVKGQDKAIKVIQSLISRNSLAGKAYWLSGKSGTGKTTIARLIASEIADPLFIEELDAQWLSPSRIKEIEADSLSHSWGKGGRAYIVNESHGISKESAQQLLTTLERIPGHVVWLFTTTKEIEKDMFGGDASPLMSRMFNGGFQLAQRDIVKPMAERLLEIARAENLDGQPLEKYIKLLQDCQSNMRAALQKIEAGEMLVS